MRRPTRQYAVQCAQGQRVCGARSERARVARLLYYLGF
jgi:hypothetical protein